VSTEQQLASLEFDMFSLEEVRLEEDYAYKILFSSDGVWTKITNVVCKAVSKAADEGVEFFRRCMGKDPKPIPHPMKKCLEEYRDLQKINAVKDVIGVIDILGIVGGDGPVDEIANQINEVTRSTPSTKSRASRIVGSTGAVLSSIGDTVLNAALLGIPRMVSAGSKVVDVAISTKARQCLACHLAFLVRLWLDQSEDLPSIEAIEQLEIVVLPSSLASTCDEMTLIERLLRAVPESKFETVEEWVQETLQNLQEITTPLMTLLMNHSYDEPSKFLDAAKAIGPVMVRKLASPDIWK
jgi:hypothetical protein